MNNKEASEPTKESGEMNDTPPGKDPHGVERDLGIAQLALTLLQGIPNREDSPRRKERGQDEQDLIHAMRQAKSLLRLASQIEQEVDIYQVFEENAFLSCKEIEYHLKENCGWPSLDSEYLVGAAVQEILELVHKEIQEHRRRMERIPQNRPGNYFEVSEAAANIRRAFKDLPVGTEIQKLLGPQSEAILQSTTDHMIERVHESLVKEEELAGRPPRVTEEFFRNVCDGLTYESYLGQFGKVDDINSTLLRAVLESLEERFEEGRSSDDESRLKDLESIDKWLCSRTNLRLDGTGVFEESIKALKDQSSGADPATEPKELFYLELRELADKWAALKIKEQIATETSDRLAGEIKKLSQSYEKLEATESYDEDEVDRFREFPHCVDAVLECLQGNRVRPRRFIYHFDANSAEAFGDNSLGSLESLLGRGIAGFRACIHELNYCLSGSFLSYEESANVTSKLEELDVQLQQQRRDIVSPSEPIRKAARERATELLDAVCTRNSNPGNINARLLFEYAAERGIKKLGKKRDQKTVTEATSLKDDCVIFPPKIFAQLPERHP